ncbi:MAG TPA: DMT family transporter [Burkholderiaceae bacterium]|nr:DMT family transporter [Burkholderiaceae bacterium]
MKKSVYIEFIVLAAIWGASFLFTRIGALEFGALPTAFVRVLVASLFLLPILLWSGHWNAFKKNAASIMFVGLLNSGIPFALYAYAVLSISTGLSAILNATVPLFGAIVAWVWLKDKPSHSRILGLFIGFVGVALLAGDKASFKPGGTGWAILACLLATSCYAIAASYTKRYLMGVPPMATATGSQIGAALGLALPAVWLWPTQAPSMHAWGAMAIVAIFCTGIAYVLYFRLIEAAGPSRTLTVTFMIPVFAIVYGAIFLGEELTWWMILCGCIIICGTALATGLVKLKAFR